MPPSFTKSNQIPNGLSKKKKYSKMTVEGKDHADASRLFLQKVVTNHGDANWVLAWDVKPIDNSIRHRASGIPYVLVANN